MSNQYAHLYQQQQPQIYDYSGATDQYSPQSGSPPLRSSVFPQPTHQLQHANSFSPPVSSIPLQYNHPTQVASSHHPISAPSPQYPQQLPRIPQVGPSSPPTSPVSNGVSRRPLPTPGAPPSQPAFRPPLPTPGPTPVPISPRSRTHSRSLRPGSLPTSSITVPSHPPASSLPSASPTSPTSGRRPLPLPRSVPGISSNSTTRSSSPAKDVVKPSSASPVAPTVPLQDPSSSFPPQTKFVPYWKRTLPDPSSDRAVYASSLHEAVNSTVSGSMSSVASPEADQLQRDRSKSFTSGRPLPPSPLDGSIGRPPVIPSTISGLGESSREFPNQSSPVRASTRPPSPIKPAKSSSSLPSTAGSSALFSPRPVSPIKSSVPSRPISPASSDDDGKLSQNGNAPQKDHRTPSPQYGIRDLPPKSRSAISRNNSTKHIRAPASIERDTADEPPRGRSTHSSTLSQPSIQSLPTLSGHRATRSAMLRSAPVLPPVVGSPRLPVSTPASPTGWPNTLPPLPRVPLPGAGEQPNVNRSRNPRQEYVNLDDAPPPSLRRSPSPSGVSSRTVHRIKTRSMAPSPQKGFAHDVRPTTRSSASVPSSPEKVVVSLPQASSAPTHQGIRNHSITPANVRQLPVERPRPQPPPVSRPPPSAFSQRFVSGKPAPAEPPVTTTRVTIPHISTPGGSSGDPDDDGGNPSIFVSEPELPQITFSDPTASSLDSDYGDVSPIDETSHDHDRLNSAPMPATGGGRVFPPASSARRGGGLACGGCGGPIVGRIVSAMGVRWHPGCFRCSDCNDLLEYVSSYERNGKPYCHFDYHEVCDLLPRTRNTGAHN